MSRPPTQNGKIPNFRQQYVETSNEGEPMPIWRKTTQQIQPSQADTTLQSSTSKNQVGRVFIVE